MRMIQLAIVAATVTLFVPESARADTLTVGQSVTRSVKKVEWQKFKLRVKAGDLVIVELNTGHNHGMLSVDKDGKHITGADNSPRGWAIRGPAMLSFTAPADGTYDVSVQSWNTTYTLTLRAGVSSAKAPATGPIAIGQKVTGALDWNDARSSRNSAADIYTLVGAQGDAVEIRMNSNDFNTILGISGPGLSQESKTDNIYDSDFSSRLSVTLPATGEYRIEASTPYFGGPETVGSQEAGTGAYTLEVVTKTTADKELADIAARTQREYGPADTHERCYYGSDYRYSDGACATLSKGVTPSELAEAKRLDPLDFGPYLLSGQSRIAARDYTGAIADLNEAIRLNRSVANAYQYRALAYQNSNQIAAAVADYNQAIQLNPSLGMSYFERGRLRYALNRSNYEAAIADYEQSRKLGFVSYSQNTQYPNAYVDRANYRQYTLGNYEGALQDYVRAERSGNSAFSTFDAQSKVLNTLRTSGRAEPRQRFDIAMDHALFQPRQSKPPASGSAVTTRRSGLLVDLIKSCPVQVSDGVEYFKATVSDQLTTGKSDPRHFDVQRLGENAALDRLGKVLDLADFKTANAKRIEASKITNDSDRPVQELMLCGYKRRIEQLNGAQLIQ